MNSTSSFKRPRTRTTSIIGEGGGRGRSNSIASSTGNDVKNGPDKGKLAEAALTKLERDLVQRAFEEETMPQGSRPVDGDVGGQRTGSTKLDSGSGLSTGLFITNATQVVNIFGAVNLPFSGIIKEMEEEECWVTFQILHTSTVGRDSSSGTRSTSPLQAKRSFTAFDSSPPSSTTFPPNQDPDPPLSRMSLADLFCFMRKLKAIYLATYHRGISRSQAAGGNDRTHPVVKLDGLGKSARPTRTSRVKLVPQGRLQQFEDTVEAVDAFRAVEHPEDPDAVYDEDVEASLQEFGISTTLEDSISTPQVTQSSGLDRKPSDAEFPALRRHMSQDGSEPTGSQSPSQVRSPTTQGLRVNKKMNLASFVSNVLGEDSSRALNALEVHQHGLAAMKEALRSELGGFDPPEEEEHHNGLRNGKMSTSATAFARRTSAKFGTKVGEGFNSTSNHATLALSPRLGGSSVKKRLKDVRKDAEAGTSSMSIAALKEKKPENHSRFATKREPNPTYNAFVKAQERKRQDKIRLQLLEEERRLRGDSKKEDGDPNTTTQPTTLTVRPDSRQGVFSAVLQLSGFVKGTPVLTQRATTRLDNPRNSRLPPLQEGALPQERGFHQGKSISPIFPN